MKKALFLLLLSFTFIFANNCDSILRSDAGSDSAIIKKYFECITEETLRDYPIPAQILARTRVKSSWYYYFKINDLIYHGYSFVELEGDFFANLQVLVVINVVLLKLFTAVINITLTATFMPFLRLCLVDFLVLELLGFRLNLLLVL